MLNKECIGNNYDVFFFIKMSTIFEVKSFFDSK